MKRKFRIKLVGMHDIAVQMKMQFHWETIKTFYLNDIPYDSNSAAEFKEAFYYNKARANELLEKLEED